MHQFYETCAYFTAARYLRQVEKVANQIYAPTGMPPAYAYIMLYLEDHGPSSITAVAQGLGYERTTVSRLVKKLAAQQLVQLTEQGRKNLVDLGLASSPFLVTANQCLDQLRAYTDEVLGPTKADMTALLTTNYNKLKERV